MKLEAAFVRATEIFHTLSGPAFYEHTNAKMEILGFFKWLE